MPTQVDPPAVVLPLALAVSPEAVNSVGVNSSSFKVQQSAKLWGNIGMVLGAITALGGALIPALPANSKWAVLAGGVVSVASMVYKGLVDLGYLKGQADKAAVEADLAARLNGK